MDNCPTIQFHYVIPVQLSKPVQPESWTDGQNCPTLGLKNMKNEYFDIFRLVHHCPTMGKIDLKKILKYSRSDISKWDANIKVPKELNQAQRIIRKFHGPSNLQRLLLHTGLKVSLVSIWRWSTLKKSGTGGLIPSKVWPHLVEAARLYGFFLTEEDYDPRPRMPDLKTINSLERQEYAEYLKRHHKQRSKYKPPRRRYPTERLKVEFVWDEDQFISIPKTYKKEKRAKRRTKKVTTIHDVVEEIEKENGQENGNGGDKK